MQMINFPDGKLSVEDGRKKYFYQKFYLNISTRRY